MAEDWYEEGLAHIWLPYAQMKTMRPPLAVAGTEGTRIRLADGRELVDGIASWWTAAHGYNHPHIRAAVAAQLGRMPHVMLGGLVHEQALRLASRLARLAPGDLSRVFFSESGSVSVEVAMKIAVQYWINRGARGRTRFATFRGNYHGDTFACMSVCDPDEGMHGHFAGALPVQLVLDLPQTDEDERRLAATLAAHAQELAAVIHEPLVQGAIGMRMHGAHVLARIARAAKAAGLLLICDEIFTGFGRTGTFFASEAAGIVPDIMTLSKALTGGTLPLAATIAREEIFAAFLDEDPSRALMHGPTYTGNALACAAANASLDLFEDGAWEERVRAVEAHLRAALEPMRGLDNVADVRVRGAIGAVELREAGDREALKARFIERGVWLRPIGKVVYTTPAFTIDEESLSRLTDAMREAAVSRR
ncbi:MAG: adenosylmethionine--8-amino-7-oxononanoate transaminase [Alphaproteobacteria bacterium]|nr:adenosylmethionine--8-amino-7-oxononanoate transaminase [Alphaproteobacteria bacterium]